MAAEPTVPIAQWELHPGPDGGLILTIRGELDVANVTDVWRGLKKELQGRQVSRLEINAGQMTSCDSAGLALLYHLSIGGLTPNATVTVIGLGPELQHLFNSYSKADYQALQDHEPMRISFVEDLGGATRAWFKDLRQLVEFIGAVSVNLAMGLMHPRKMRWPEVLRVFETAGVNALPIVSLLTCLIGMVIAFEAAQPLAQLGAQVFVANLLGLTICRELGPVMAAIMLAGRSGSAFAAELGTMKVNEELNALETMGLSPIQFLVVQRVLAGILLTPVLTIYAMYAGLVGGIPVLMGLGFPLRMILRQIQISLQFGDLAEGMCKSIVFGGIVATVSCLRGLQTGEGPRAVGESTTRSVVSSILLIILADAVFAALTYTLRK